MRKELRAAHDRLTERLTHFTTARDAVPKFKADAEAARVERNRLLDSDKLDPYSDADALTLTVLDNRARLLDLKAERTEARLDGLLQAANEESVKARSVLRDLLRADAEALTEKTAAKLAKSGDLDEAEAREAAACVGAVRDAWRRLQEAETLPHDSAPAIIEALQVA
jgi:hypothetical protein